MKTIKLMIFSIMPGLASLIALCLMLVANSGYSSLPDQSKLFGDEVETGQEGIRSQSQLYYDLDAQVQINSNREQLISSKKSEILNTYRLYVMGLVSANKKTLEDTSRCFLNPEKEKEEFCKVARKKAFEEIVPAFISMRKYLALSELVDEPSPGNFHLTENEFYWQYLPFKINLNPDHLFDDWTFLDSTDGLPKVPKLQQISWDELVSILKEDYLKDTKTSKAAWNLNFELVRGKKLVPWLSDLFYGKDSLYLGMKREVLSQMYNDEYKKLIASRMRYQATERVKRRKEYKEKYWEVLQKFPEVVFMTMPTAMLPEKKEIFANDTTVQCYKEISELYSKVYDQRKNALAQKWSQNQTKRYESDLQSSLHLCDSFGKLPRYSLDPKDFEESLKNAYLKMSEIQEVFYSEMLNYQESMDYEMNLYLAGLEKAMNSFTTKVIAEDEIAKEIAIRLTKEAESKEMWDDMEYVGYLVALVGVCATVLRRYGIATVIGKIINVGICTVVPGLPADYFFFNIANNRYEQTYLEFFSTPGSGEALQSISKLDSRDQDLFLELLLTGVLSVGPDLIHGLKVAPELILRRFR